MPAVEWVVDISMPTTCRVSTCHEEKSPGSEYCETHEVKQAAANTARYTGGDTLGSLAGRIRAARKSGLISPTVAQYAPKSE